MAVLTTSGIWLLVSQALLAPKLDGKGLSQELRGRSVKRCACQRQEAEEERSESVSSRVCHAVHGCTRSQRCFISVSDFS